MEQNEQITVAKYQATAKSFKEGTWNHDVSQNRDRLVQNLPRNPGKILYRHPGLPCNEQPWLVMVGRK